MAFLNKGLEMVVRDERPSADDLAEAVADETVAGDVDQAGDDAIKPAADGGIEQVFKYDKGLVDYGEHLHRRKDKAKPSIIPFAADSPVHGGQNGTHISLE